VLKTNFGKKANGDMKEGKERSLQRIWGTTSNYRPWKAPRAISTNHLMHDEEDVPHRPGWQLLAIARVVEENNNTTI
jgi:hypothetical protein